jgi:hypothetical protein
LIRPLALALLIASPALAETAPMPRPAPLTAQNCADRNEIIAALADGYEELPHSIAVTPKSMVETLVNRRTGTWTQITTTLDGRTCVTLFGRGWHVVEGDPL